MLGRSRFRDRGRGSGVGGANLLNQATIYLGGVAPYHWLDFINNRALYAGADVGNVTGATGYSFSRASDGYYTNADGTLTNFASGAVRRGDRGVLIEGSRTNLLLRSQEFDNAAWTKVNSTVTANATTAPDGTTTAEKLVENSATDFHTIRPTTSVGTVTATECLSVFAKASERSWIALQLGSSRSAYFNLSAGTIGTTFGGTTATMTALANGWYRCSIAGERVANQGNTILLASADNTASYAGDGTSGVFLWGAQLEAASFPSSYVKSEAASATRAADSLVYTAGVSYPLSLWAEFERAVDTGGLETQVQIDDGTGNNRVALTVASTDVANAFSVVGGVAQSSETVAGALAIGTTYKASVRFASNDVRMARGGTLSAGDVSATNPPAPTTIRIGRDTASAEPFGYIRRAAVFNSALTDAQLQTTTSG